LVGTTRGAGNSNKTLSYSMIDDQPYAGVSYYRLKQTDFDGKYTYSKMVVVDFNKINNADLVVYPNPNKTGEDISISVFGNKNSAVAIDIYDGLGRKQYSKILNLSAGSDSITTIVPSQIFAPGIYVVTVTSGETVLNKNLIIK
jgi:hypothetical protein